MNPKLLRLLGASTLSLILGCGGATAPDNDNRSVDGTPFLGGSPGEPLPPQPNIGPRLTLRIAYALCDIHDANDCLLNRAVLTESEVSIFFSVEPTKIAYGGTAIVYDARTSDGSIANVIETDCDSNSCQINLRTGKSGDVTLEVFDRFSGAIQAREILRVRSASSIESKVSTRLGAASPNAEGFYDLAVGDQMLIRSSAKSETGETLLFTRGAFELECADLSKLSPVEVDGFVWPPGDAAIAKSRGRTTLTISNAATRNTLNVNIR